MATYRQIEESIISWVETVTGIRAILANQSVPQPPKPYLSVALMGDKGIGTAHETVTADTQTEQIQTIWPRGEIHASISAYASATVSDGSSPTAFETLRKLRDSAQLNSQRSALALVSLVVMDTGEVLNIPELVNDVQWQGRAVMDVTFSVTHDPVVENVPWVERASGSGMGTSFDTGHTAP